MNLKINRLRYSPRSTCGEMWIDGTFFCYTLERPSRDFVGAIAPFSIPGGVYTVAPRWSNHLQMNVLGVNNVPGRTDIEIHPANYPSQLLGCIAVGDKQSEDYVGDSRLTFSALLQKTKDQSLELEIV